MPPNFEFRILGKQILERKKLEALESKDLFLFVNEGAASVLLGEMDMSSCDPHHCDSQAFAHCFLPPVGEAASGDGLTYAAGCWACHCQQNRMFPFYVCLYRKVTNTRHDLLLQRFNSIKGENYFVCLKIRIKYPLQ